MPEELAESEAIKGGPFSEISVFSPFKNKVQELFDMKRTYENMFLSSNFVLERDRNNILNMAKLLYANDDLFSQADIQWLLASISAMEHFNTDIKNKLRNNPYLPTFILEEESKGFRASANVFLKRMNTLLKKYGMGTKTKKQEDQIRRTYLALQIKPIFRNSYGIRISPEMDFFARACYVRACTNRDNIISVEGPRGNGKTTFGLAFLTTYLGYAKEQNKDLKFEFDKNLVINEDKDFVTTLFSHLEQFQAIQLDEAGNQANKKLWYDIDQIEFMNYVTRFRIKNFTVLVVWPDMKDIDPGLTTKHGIINISIYNQGMAIVKAINRNPYAGQKTVIPFASKNRIAITGQEAEDISRETDLLNVLEIPYFDIEHDSNERARLFWEQYSLRKNDSLKVSNITKRYGANKNMDGNDMYTKFLLDMPADSVRITATLMNDYGKKAAFAYSFKKLATIIARATGRQWHQIVKYEGPPVDPNINGYIDIDDYIKTYLSNLRAKKAGSEAVNGI